MFDEKQIRALENLIFHAKRNSGQATRVANFLLCWWNAQDQGSFVFTEVWGLDSDILRDVLIVFVAFANNQGVYPDALGYEKDFQEIIRRQR